MKIENIGLPHRITIDALTLQKFNHILFGKYSLEFTAFCHAEKKDNHHYHIYDIFFPRQENSAALTECDASDLIELMGEGADISKLTGHMHSHVNMGVFASGTDKKDILERAQECGYNVALILNKKGEIFGHIADYTTGIYIQEVPVSVIYPAEFEAELLAQIKSLTSIQAVQEFMDYGIEYHFEDLCPLSTEEEARLDAIVKDRFKTKTYVNNYNNSTGTGVGAGVNDFKKNIYPLTTISKSAEESARTFLDNEELDVEEIIDDAESAIPDDPYDYFTDEEMAIIERCMEVTDSNSLTEREWNLLTEYDALYGNYVPY